MGNARRRRTNPVGVDSFLPPAVNYNSSSLGPGGLFLAHYICIKFYVLFLLLSYPPNSEWTLQEEEACVQ